MRTEVSFQNYKEKEKKKICGSISPQNLLFDQVTAIKSGSNTSLNTQHDCCPGFNNFITKATQDQQNERRGVWRSFSKNKDC